MNNRAVLRVVAFAALLAQSSAWSASVIEQWKAVSTTASSITGDITIAVDRITFGNGTSLPLAAAGRAPDFDSADGRPVNAMLFRVTAPDDPVLLSGNRLCGGQTPRPVTFVAFWRSVRSGGGVDLHTLAVFSGSERPTGAGGPGLCGTYNYVPGKIRMIAGRAPAANGGVHCPGTFQGKAFMQVTLFDGPPGEQMALKPRQDDAAENSPKPVAGWDRWKLTPLADNRRYTLVCHYSSVRHEVWSRQTLYANANLEIELPADVTECFQKRRADTTSLGITCK